MDMDVVESAARVIKIFEYFAEIRRPATVTEINRALKMPQSSTTKILHTLLKLGYLHLAATRHLRA